MKEKQMKITIDTTADKCEIDLHAEDTNHIKNLLLIKQASSMANPDSLVTININKGFKLGFLGEVELFAKEIIFDLAMKHGDIQLTGDTKLVKIIEKFRRDTLRGTQVE